MALVGCTSLKALASTVGLRRARYVAFSARSVQSAVRAAHMGARWSRRGAALPGDGDGIPGTHRPSIRVVISSYGAVGRGVSRRRRRPAPAVRQPKAWTTCRHAGSDWVGRCGSVCSLRLAAADILLVCTGRRTDHNEDRSGRSPPGSAVSLGACRSCDPVWPTRSRRRYKPRGRLVLPFRLTPLRGGCVRGPCLAIHGAH